MMFTLIAAAAALALPTPDTGFARTIETGASEEVRDSGLVAMWYEAFVAPNGTIESCTVRAAIGDGDAALAVCRAFVGRRAKPAVGPDGRPAYGYARGSLNFSDNLEPISAEAIEADVSISARGLPNSRARVDLIVLIDAGGKIAACEPGEKATGLSQAACDQVRSMAMPVRQVSGAPVSYLYPMIVEFRRDNG
jgi:hypothetical protein